MDYLVESNDSDPANSTGTTQLTQLHPVTKVKEDRCNGFQFRDLCKLFELISSTKGVAKKLPLLFNGDLKKFLQGESIFPLLRLVLPANDTERGKYSLKQASIAKTYVEALHLDKQSNDSIRLTNWKDPALNQLIDQSKLISGDFGLILEDVLRPRVRSKWSSRSLGEVNALLNKLAAAITLPEKVDIIKTRILNDFCAIEQKWLVRIILQDLKIGLKHENVLKMFYPTAMKRFNECTNLRTVCEEEHMASKSTSGICLFVNFKPMLAQSFQNSSSGQISAAESAMGELPFVMDLKLDGERMLIHIDEDNSFTMYTRNGNDYTDNYWTVTHNIINSLRKRGKFSCILDGEICALNGQDKTFVPFGKNLTIAKIEREHYERNNTDQLYGYKDLDKWMHFIAFDVVYLDGEGSNEVISKVLRKCGLDTSVTVESGDISSLPLIVRRKVLEEILEVEEHRVTFVACRYVTETDPAKRRLQIDDYFDEMVLNGEEGLVLKSLNSIYKMNERDWVKLKPEYGDSIDDIDVLVLGGYFGEGRRGIGVSTFLIGVKDSANGQIYQTLCKVGTGYNIEELSELRRKLDPVAIRWKSSSPPPHLAHCLFLKKDQIPDFYYPPESSVVFQIKCAEFVDNKNFSCGVTCRFPRVERIRYDKSCEDILTVDDLMKIRNKPRNFNNGVTGGSSRNGNGGGNGGAARRGVKRGGDALSASAIAAGTGTAGVSKQRLGSFNSSHFSVSQTSRLASQQGVADESQGTLFRGCVFCIPHNTQSAQFSYGDRQFTRDGLTTDIQRQGGTVVGTATSASCQVIAIARTVQVQNYVLSGKYDVLDFRYVVDCLDRGALLDKKGYHYLSMSEATREGMRGVCDEFGDGFAEEVDEQELALILGNARDVTESLRVDKSLSQADRNKRMRTQTLLSEYDRVLGMRWADLLSSYFTSSEREQVVGDHEASCLCAVGVVVYVDVYGDFGSEDPSEDSQQDGDRPRRSYDPVLSAAEVIVLTTAASRLASRRATLAHSLHTAVTHVVTHAHIPSRLQRLQERMQRFQRKGSANNPTIRVVSTEWVDACISAKKLLDADAFVI